MGYSTSAVVGDKVVAVPDYAATILVVDVEQNSSTAILGYNKSGVFKYLTQIRLANSELHHLVDIKKGDEDSVVQAIIGNWGNREVPRLIEKTFKRQRPPITSPKRKEDKAKRFFKVCKGL